MTRKTDPGETICMTGARPSSRGEVPVIREMPHMRELPPGMAGAGAGPPMSMVGYPLVPGMPPDPTRLSPRPPR